MTEFTLNKGFNPEGQAKLIAKGAGLGLVKAGFFAINYTKASDANVIETDSYLAKGTLSGVPVFDAVILKKPIGTGNNTQTFTGGSSTAPIDTINDLILPIALLTINQEKNIVRTNVQGRNGSVKEYVSDGDYQISIKGVIVGEDSNKPPIEDLKKLDTFCKSPFSLDVVSNVLDYFKIYTVVISGYDYEQREGMRNVFDFSINCYSDEPFEIKSNA